MSRKNKTIYVDDGRTVADMSADWMPWNRGMFRRRGERGERRRRRLSKEEKNEQKQTYRAAVWAMYKAMLPQLLCVAAAFAIVFILLMLWLK